MTSRYPVGRRRAPTRLRRCRRSAAARRPARRLGLHALRALLARADLAVVCTQFGIGDGGRVRK